MIKGTLKNLGPAGDLGLGDRFAKGFACLRDLRSSSEHVAGKIDLEADELWATVFIKEGRAPENAQLEYHARYADIHLCLAGRERIGLIPSLDDTTASEPFNEQDDFGLLTNGFDEIVEISDDSFIIFFPGEPHAPLIGDGILTKVCVKVLVQD